MKLFSAFSETCAFSETYGHLGDFLELYNNLKFWMLFGY